MIRRPGITPLLFAALGGTLLIYLVLPLVYLLFRLDWRQIGPVLAAPQAVRAVGVSLLTSTVATAMMTLLGVPLGYLLARERFPGRTLVTALVFVPMVLPPLVGGILLLLLCGPYGMVGALLETRGISLVNSLTGVILAQIFVAAPYVVVAALSSFSSVDPELEKAAATLGDSRWRSFRRIALPLAWPGIAAGVTLAWVRTIGEFGATLVVAYHPYTVPVYLWVQLASEGLGAALPLALCLVGLAAAAMAGVALLGRLSISGSRSALPVETWRR
ncbi:MAG: ABC transporter permease [Acidobacteriota bacterium]|nr:ABC transporter permease [Acidobacteriota bacterium]